MDEKITKFKDLFTEFTFIHMDPKPDLFKFFKICDEISEYLKDPEFIKYMPDDLKDEVSEYFNF